MYKEIEQKVLEKHPQSKIKILEYKGFNRKVKYKCQKCQSTDYRNQYKTLLYSKYACKKCNDGERSKGKIQLQVESIMEDNNFKVLEWRGVNERAKVYCNRCNTEVFRYPQSILKSPSYCPNCSISKSHTSYTFTEAQEVLNKYAGNEEFTLLEYEGSQKPSLVRHQCGFIFRRKLWNFQISRGCPKCQKKQSSLEKKVEKYLVDNQIEYFSQVRFFECNDGKSSFDFQCFNSKGEYCLVEVQGQQHYYNIDIFDGIKENERRDNIKKEYCLANGILLVEIPYYDISNLDRYLSFLKSSTTISKESTSK